MRIGIKDKHHHKWNALDIPESCHLLNTTFLEIIDCLLSNHDIQYIGIDKTESYCKGEN